MPDQTHIKLDPTTGLTAIVGTQDALPIVQGKRAGDAFNRVEIYADGTVVTGDGTATPAIAIALLPATPAEYTITNETLSRTFDADTVDVAGLADVVATLIADLEASGLVTIA